MFCTYCEQRTEGSHKLCCKTENGEKKLKILHVAGSPTDDFRFRLNILYAGAFPTDLGDGKYEFTFVLVRPDQSWIFADKLSDIADPETLKEKTTDLKRMDIAGALYRIKTEIKPDAVVVHFFCEKGQTIYRGLFEALGIPLIGPGAEQCFTVVDKLKTRNMLLGDGNNDIPCPEALAYRKGDTLNMEAFSYPCVVKANKGEDSTAVRLAKDATSFKAAFDNALSYSDTVIIERFIKGREFRCAVIESLENGTLETLIPQEYKVRQDDIRTTEDKLRLDDKLLPLCKAPTTRTWFLDPSTDTELIHRIQQISLRAFRVLGMRDFALFDFRVDSEGNPWILECNLFCSFGPQSVLNAHAKHVGMTDERIFDMMLQNALLREK